MYRIRAMRRSTKNPPNVNPAISFRIHINAATKSGNNATARMTAAIMPRILKKVSILIILFVFYCKYTKKVAYPKIKFHECRGSRGIPT